MWKDRAVGEAESDASLGRAIMAARIEQGLKRAELAEATGLSYTFLSEIERGIKRGSEKSVYLIADALGMRPSELLIRAESLRDRGEGRLPTESMHRMASVAPSRPRGPEDRLVDRIMGVVTAEVNRFLVEELEPIVREEVRAHLRRDL